MQRIFKLGAHKDKVRGKWVGADGVLLAYSKDLRGTGYVRLLLGKNVVEKLGLDPRDIAHALRR